MRRRWSTAPVWLRVLGVLGVPAALALFALGLPLLLTRGPGLLVILLGWACLAPWVFIALEKPGERG